MNRTILLALGAILFVVGLAVSLMEWSSGAQPWGQLLGDNFIFARTLPFTIGLGIVLGYWKAAGAPLGTQRRASMEQSADLPPAPFGCTRLQASP